MAEVETSDLSEDNLKHHDQITQQMYLRQIQVVKEHLIIDGHVWKYIGFSKWKQIEEWLDIVNAESIVHLRDVLRKVKGSRYRQLSELIRDDFHVYPLHSWAGTPVKSCASHFNREKRMDLQEGNIKPFKTSIPSPFPARPHQSVWGKKGLRLYSHSQTSLEDNFYQVGNQETSSKLSAVRKNVFTSLQSLKPRIYIFESSKEIPKRNLPTIGTKNLKREKAMIDAYKKLV